MYSERKQSMQRMKVASVSERLRIRADIAFVESRVRTLVPLNTHREEGRMHITSEVAQSPHVAVACTIGEWDFCSRVVLDRGPSPTALKKLQSLWCVEGASRKSIPTTENGAECSTQRAGNGVGT
ncbi:hypothetical protein TNCV_124551 [Trichonephila clavipes]|nr:hypothetical protein TNCV_124551 [Trichonephila clavipes]